MTIILGDDGIMTDGLFDQHVSSADPHGAAFPLVRHGYSPEAVRAFIASSTDELARMGETNRVLTSQLKQLQTQAIDAGRTALNRAEAAHEVERYLEAGRREAAETVLRARQQARTIVAEAQSYADQVAAEAHQVAAATPVVDDTATAEATRQRLAAEAALAEVQAQVLHLDRRRRAIAESLLALQQVLGAAAHELVSANA